MSSEACGIVLALLISPTTGNRVVDLARFSKVVRSLLLLNPMLCEELSSVLLVGCGSAMERGFLSACSSILEDASLLLGHSWILKKTPILCIQRDSVGRALNDMLAWAEASLQSAHLLLWDDVHECLRPFIHSARTVFTSGPSNLWQLALTDVVSEWGEEDPRLLSANALWQMPQYALLMPQQRNLAGLQDAPPSGSSEAFWSRGDAGRSPIRWPQFTLGPSLHSLRQFRQASRNGSSLRFSECWRKSWQDLQWSFGLAWESQGGTCAQLQPPPARAFDYLPEGVQQE